MDKDLEKQLRYWIEASSRDLKVMNSLFKNRHYPYALFIGHLVIEKILKAYYIKNTGRLSPYTHSLILLAEKSKLQIDEKQLSFLESVNEFNIEARYPDIKFSFYKKCNLKFAKTYMNRIKEFYSWVKKML